MITGVTAKDGIRAGHIDPVQPVGAGAGQRRDAQGYKFAVGAQAVNRPLHRLRVKIVDQTALHLLTLFRRQLQIVKYLIHQQLTLSVRVTGMNDFLRIAEQTLNHVKLFGHRWLRLELPLFRHDRQVEQVPARIARIIDIGLGLLQQVADAPGDHLPVTALNIAVTFAMRFWQHLGDGAAETRFFCNKQPHEINGSQSWGVRRGRLPARR